MCPSVTRSNHHAPTMTAVTIAKAAHIARRSIVTVLVMAARPYALRSCKTPHEENRSPYALNMLTLRVMSGYSKNIHFATAKEL